VREPRTGRIALVALLAACAAAALAGCGSSEQTAHEPKARFPMEVVRASFPSRQAVARPATLELVVRNTGSRALPNVAVSLDSFYYVSNYPHLADRHRPVWAIEQGPGPIAKPPVQTQEVSVPGGGQTAYVNTWAFGRLAPGATRTFTWHVVPVKPGPWTVHYRLAAGLAGNARAVASSGSLQGALAVDVAGAPPKTHVDPHTGKVVPGPFLPGSSS